MLNKKEVQQAGYEVIDSAAKLPAEQAEKVSQIKSILPSLVNSDGMVSMAALKDLLGEQNFASSNQGYSLNFAGKGLAKIKADTPTTKCLKIEEKQSENFATTGNVIIRGDNLDVLKILRQNYTGKIKMIYIDPPYNTGNANFVYADDFRMREVELIERFGIDNEAVNFFKSIFGTQTHSGWLFTMYPRLKLARDLLTDDGVIFISIDDNEQANLKLLCDEIFGDGNFVSQIVWEKMYTTKNDSAQMSDCHEYVLCYAKNSVTYPIGLLPRTAEMDARYKNIDNDHRGPWKPVPLYAKGESKGGRYTITAPSGKIFEPLPNQHWLYREDDVKRMMEEGRIYFGRDGNSQPNVKRFLTEVQQGAKAKTLWKHDDVGSNDSAKRELRTLFDKGAPFDFPKPTGLIIKMLLLATTVTGEDLILDFFSGSGTTAEAVMRLNAKDSGNRKFILVQWDETIDKKSSPQAHKFCIDNQFKPVISSITFERVKRAGKKIKAENGSLTFELDMGYKVFSLTDRPVIEKTADGKYQLKFSEGTIKEVLYNMMTASGEVLLTAPIEEIEKNLLYKVGNSYFVLGECKISPERFSSNRIYINGYANIHLERWLNMLGLNKDNIKVLYY